MHKLLKKLSQTLIFSAAISSGAAQGEVLLNIAYQDAGFPALIKKSGVLDNAPFKVEWVLLTGPAANLSALYSGAIDLGYMGDTSLTIEQANARKEWTHTNAPLKIVAGWRNDYNKDFPPLVTAVRTSANIDDLKSLANKKWSYNYGGYNHAQYLVSLIQAGYSEKDIDPKKFNDGAPSAAAFNSGQTDVYSGSLGPILQTVHKGDARILLDDRATGIPALNVWTARKEVLDDPSKDAALKSFFERLSGYWQWHDQHKEDVVSVLRETLKLTPERAELEYELRSGAFRPFDAALLNEEQKVADALFKGGAIKRNVDVSIGFDARYNQAQRAVAPKAVR